MATNQDHDPGSGDRLIIVGGQPVPKHKPSAPTILAGILTMLIASTAVAQPTIHRCVGEDGVATFSDRACSRLDLYDYEAPSTEVAVIARPSLSQGCARDIETLQSQIRAALAYDDVNSFAGLYHWVGASAYTVDMVMPRLKAVARTRMVEMGVESIELDGVGVPVNLWLDQTNPDTPEETVRIHFDLVMNAGCWWLHG